MMDLWSSTGQGHFPLHIHNSVWSHSQSFAMTAASQRPGCSQLLAGAELHCGIRSFLTRSYPVISAENWPLASAQTLDVVKGERNLEESRWLCSLGCGLRLS